MRRYFLLAASEFRRQSTYRLALVAGVFTNTVFGFIRLSVLYGALLSAGGTLAGYDEKSAASYVWLGQGLLATLGFNAQHEVSERVRTGEVAIDLARPIDMQLSFWARDLGRAALQFPTRGLPPIVLGALITGIALPASWTAYPLGVLSLLIGVSISFLLRWGVNLISFWTIDVRGFTGLYFVVMSLLCGLYVPVHIFPDWLQAIAHASPFPSMFQSPIDVLTGRVLGAEAWQLIGTQLAWMLGLVLLTRVMLRFASSKLVVQGG